MHVESDGPRPGLPTIQGSRTETPPRPAIVDALILAPEGDRFLPGRRIVVGAGGRIATCAEKSGSETDGDALSLLGVYLIPGLIDAHCHLIERSSAAPDDAEVAAGTLEGLDAARAAIRLGVTAVRDAGTRHSGIYALQARFAGHPAEGPELHPAGPNIAGPTIPADWRARPARGPEAVRRLVAACHQAGAAWIKLIVSQMLFSTGEVVRHMSDEEIAAAADAAHDSGLRVGAHCEGDDAVRAAAASGVDCVEHGLLASDESIALMASNGVAFVPTLAAYEANRMERAGEVAVERLADYRAEVESAHREAVAAARAAGVLVAAGSDGSYADGSPTLLDELDALRAAGLSTAEALASATSDAARVMGSEDVRGSIEPGRAADLVGVRADPLAATSNLRDVAFVMRAGRVVYADEGLAG